eukprot:8985494-Pyramimonas_sp.AAC.1
MQAHIRGALGNVWKLLRPRRSTCPGASAKKAWAPKTREGEATADAQGKIAVERFYLQSPLEKAISPKPWPVAGR